MTQLSTIRFIFVTVLVGAGIGFTIFGAVNLVSCNDAGNAKLKELLYLGDLKCYATVEFQNVTATSIVGCLGNTTNLEEVPICWRRSDRRKINFHTQYNIIGAQYRSFRESLAFFVTGLACLVVAITSAVWRALTK